MLQFDQVQYLRRLVLTLSLIASVSSFYVIPLRAGTIQILDNELRLNKVMRRQIDVNLTKEAYESHKDTTVIASITELSMDDQLSFYFQYNIFCPKTQCLLNFTIVRKSVNVNPDFNYHVQVDYLVARGLKILQLNMTSYQEHLYLSFINSYNEKNQKENLGAFQPINNQDAMRIMAIPNGFSNLTRTGRVVYLYTMNKDMYVVHYMQHENGHGEHDSMGWPEGADYIRYKVLFFDASYHPAGCKHEDKWSLLENYTHNCGDNTTKWFFGFKSTKEKSIKARSKQNFAGYTFNLTDTTTAQYGVVGFPFETNPEFIDLRITKYVEIGVGEQRSVGFLVIASIVLSILIVLLITKIVTKQKQSNNQKQNFKQVDGKSETFSSARDESTPVKI